MALSGGQKTRLGASGVPRHKYASFAGKASAAPVAALKLHTGLMKNVGKTIGTG